MEPRFEVTSGLTRDDIAAFRISTDWSLHLGPTVGSFIRLYVDGEASKGPVPVYTTRQQVLFADESPLPDRRARVIPVNATVYGYGDGLGDEGWVWSPSRDTAVPECFSSRNRRDARATLARALREGDVLSLRWIADNNTDNIRAVGYHADEVSLVATLAGKPTNVWAIDHQIGPDNSARMIRRR